MMNQMAKETDSGTPSKKNPGSKINSAKTQDPIDCCFSTALTEKKTKQETKKKNQPTNKPTAKQIFLKP